MPEAQGTAEAINPKDLAGRAKPQLHLIPLPALLPIARVMELGAAKYGGFNWRDTPIGHTPYISAMFRHLIAFAGGEDVDPESGQSHLAHIASGAMILLDAREAGSAKDDRPGGVVREPANDDTAPTNARGWNADGLPNGAIVPLGTITVHTYAERRAALNAEQALEFGRMVRAGKTASAALDAAEAYRYAKPTEGDRLRKKEEVAEHLRQYTALRYIGDCKCGACQLVPRALIDEAIAVLCRAEKSAP